MKTTETCLVTGGAGFIGSHVADELLRMKKKVVVLDDLSGGFRENVPAKAEFVKGSVSDHRLVDRLFRERRITRVYHLAAYAAENLSHFIKRFNYVNNLVGSVNLINNAVNHGVKCFVFTSSIAVYGDAKPPFSETQRPVPADSYGIAKLAVEDELRITKELFGLDYVIFRPHNVYGERQNIGDKYRNVVGIFMNQVLRAEPLTVFGDGLQVRAFTYIRDIAGTIALSGFRPSAWNRAYNIGSETRTTVNEVAEEVARTMGVLPEIRHLPARHEAKFAWSRHELARRHFPRVKETPLEQGIARMADWVLAHGARKSRDFQGIEIERNLPPSWSPKKNR